MRSIFSQAALKTYAGRPESLPVGQHMLLALMKPRPLHVASAEDDQWADPNGEFLSALQVEPVYALYGKTGLGTDQMASENRPFGEAVRDGVCTGKHEMIPYDWEQYTAFAEKHFGIVAEMTS